MKNQTKNQLAMFCTEKDGIGGVIMKAIEDWLVSTTEEYLIRLLGLETKLNGTI